MNDDGLDIPEFLKIPQARRKAAWKGFKPHPHHQSISIERWREYELQRKAETRQKTVERIAAFRASRGMNPFYE
jgi:hypothetical protein